MATLEQANKCPDCGSTGEEISSQSIGFDGKLVQLACKNAVCKYNNNDVNVIWMVQVRQDGTIPDPQSTRSRPVEYSSEFEREYKAAEAYVKGLLDASTKPQGEV